MANPVAFGIPPYMVHIPRATRYRLHNEKPEISTHFFKYVTLREQRLHVKCDTPLGGDNVLSRVVEQRQRTADNPYPNLRMPVVPAGPVHARRVVSYKRKLETEQYLGTILLDNEKKEYDIILPRGFVFSGPGSSKKDMTQFESALVYNYLYATHIFDKDTVSINTIHTS